MRPLTDAEAAVLGGTSAGITRVRTLRATAETEYSDTTITLEQYRSANPTQEVTP